MIYDITPPIGPDLAVWPGDTPVSREVLMDLERGDSVTLSTLRATVHLGAHADAPSHYGVGQPSIEAAPLERYLGRCALVRPRAEPRDGRLGVDALPPTGESRVLIATGSYPEFDCFDRGFVALAPELVDRLAERGVTLVGVDTPSVDSADSKDLPAHGRCLHHGISILESLKLEGVPEGVYELIALPLPLVGFDASPVRAVLRTLPSSP